VVSRRTLLSVTAGMALGTLASIPTAEAASITAAAAKTKPVPRTLAVARAVRKGSLRVQETSFELTHLGVAWQGLRPHVRVRTAAGWAQWRAVDGCSGGRDGRADPGGSALLVVPGTVGYEVSVAGAGSAEITELNTVDGPAIQQAAAVARVMPLPDGTTCAVPYLSRAAWGADESKRFRSGDEYWPAEYFPVQTLTVHHTAGVNNDPDPAATVRAIYHFQAITNDWGDIGYHVIIDEAGRAYEGRWSGPDAVPVFGTTLGTDGRPQMSVGAHVLGYNVGNISVCLLGNYTSRLPTSAAMSSLNAILAGLARVSRLNVLGTTSYVNPVNSNAKTVRTLSGHRNWTATECPGDTFYPQLPALRSSVARRVIVPAEHPRWPSLRPPRPRP